MLFLSDDKRKERTEEIFGEGGTNLGILRPSAKGETTQVRLGIYHRLDCGLGLKQL